MTKIMLLEDDMSIARGLKYSLEKSGFEIDVLPFVADARAALENTNYDLLLLDVTLPDGTGFEVCEYVRGKGESTPIIFLTAADEETDITMGLDMGGDDYITKPFKLAVLLSRINAILRRSNNFAADSSLASNGITVP